MTFSEERCHPSDPRPGPATCDWCEEPYNRGDDRFGRPHPVYPEYMLTICETCAGKFMGQDLADGIAIALDTGQPAGRKVAA